MYSIYMTSQNEAQRLPVVHLSEMFIPSQKELLLENCTISESWTDNQDGKKSSYPLFYLFRENKSPIMVYQNSTAGKQLRQFYDKIVNTMFNLELKQIEIPNMKPQITILKIVKVGNARQLPQTQLIGF